tara:strand:+ start:972 stop:2711 length:1740 start_codon:yes stop_codon:yes gene_type:complete
MTTHYINPSHTNNGDGDGTADQVGAGGAFNTWDSVAFTNTDTYLQAAGTAENVALGAGTITINAKSAITIGSYGTGADPVVQNYKTSSSAGDWTSIASEGSGFIWEYIHNDSAGNNGSYILGHGTLGAVLGNSIDYSDSGGSVDVWVNFGDWSCGRADKALYIYSDINPVLKWGAIYWCGDSDRCFLFKNSDTIEFSGYQLKNAAAGFVISVTTAGVPHGSGNYHALYIAETDKGCLFSSADATKVLENANLYNITTRKTNAAGIQPACYSDTVTVHDNDIDTWGVAESTGGIYGSNVSLTGEEIKVYRNKVRGGSWGKYWEDGDGIYFDNGSSGCTVYANDIADGPDAEMGGLRDNSGGARMVWHSNIVSNYAHLAIFSDSQSFDSAATMVFNNTGIGLTNGIAITGNLDVGSLNWVNNIMVGTGSALLINPSATATLSHVLNCYFGFSDTTDVEVGAILTTPALLGFRVGAGSTSDGTGLDVTPYTDYDGVAFSTTPPLGAYAATANLYCVNTGSSAAGTTNYDAIWSDDGWAVQGDNSLHYPMNEGAGTLLAYDGTGAANATYNAPITGYDVDSWE